MKKVLLFLVLVALAGCGTVEYRDRYAALPIPEEKLIDYDVPPPPVTSIKYSVMDWDSKESAWTDYTNDLLSVIGKHQADKLGLRESKKEFEKQILELNKKAGSK